MCCTRVDQIEITKCWQVQWDFAEICSFCHELYLRASQLQLNNGWNLLKVFHQRPKNDNPLWLHTSIWLSHHLLRAAKMCHVMGPNRTHARQFHIPVPWTLRQCRTRALSKRLYPVHHIWASRRTPWAHHTDCVESNWTDSSFPVWHRWADWEQCGSYWAQVLATWFRPIQWHDDDKSYWYDTISTLDCFTTTKTTKKDSLSLVRKTKLKLRKVKFKAEILVRNVTLLSNKSVRMIPLEWLQCVRFENDRKLGPCLSRNHLT